MAKIDKFIEALHQRGGDHIEASVGERVTLVDNGARRPMTRLPLTLDQVAGLLTEIIPPDAALSGEGDQQQFAYAAPSGDVTVRVSRGQGSLQFLITPLGATDLPGANGERNEATASAQEAPVVASVQAAPVVASSAGRARIEGLFVKTVEEGCSDLHIATGVEPLFRRNGDIVSLTEEVPLTAAEAKEILLSITPQHKRDEFDQTHDIDFAYEIPEVARFRCNIFLDRKGMGGAFRVIPTDILSVEQLNLPKDIVDLCSLSKGLVLVTGPTGSGKSTTLAALIDHINTNRTDHVLTIEDPIEFVHENKKCLINQREVGVHTKSFKSALRAALREDPDVVLVGELRDLETVAIAIETAETGHLVFGTLHTNTAPSTVDRIIDQFSADQQGQIRTMLAESLKAVVSQTLVKAKKGGRLAALEFLLVTSAVSNLIREGKTYQIPAIMQTSKSIGMQPMNDALLELVLKDKITPEVAYDKCIDRKELESLFARNSITLPKK